MNSTLETTFLWCKIGWIFTWTCFWNEMIGRFWVIWVLKLVKIEKIEPIFFKILENLKSTFSDAIRPPQHFWIYRHALKNASKWPKIAFENKTFLPVLYSLSKNLWIICKTLSIFVQSKTASFLTHPNLKIRGVC